MSWQNLERNPSVSQTILGEELIQTNHLREAEMDWGRRDLGSQDESSIKVLFFLKCANPFS